jgi:hypothetical protein
MSKSSYPSKIDSSNELPIVRDNILEIGSEAINSLRSAIIQIEKTLGINPQGAVGETVSSRLSQSLDGAGNLLSDAIEKAGLLTGPIVDQDVSSGAGIREEKLRLNFPTSVLQSQISSLNSEMQDIIARINAISFSLSAHLSSASNRHAASSISTSVISNSASATAIKESAASDVQVILEDIFSGHINFNGIVSEENSPHKASQIWVDSSAIDSVSTNVQQALENLSASSGGELALHQSSMHSSGVQKFYNLTQGALIAQNLVVSYEEKTGEEKGISQVLFSPALLASDYEIKPGYDFVISNETDDEGLSVGTYNIFSIIYSSDELSILGVKVWGEFGIASNSFSRAAIYKNNYVSSAQSSFLFSPRQVALSAESFILQVCNPESAYVISSGIRPSEITSSNRFVNIKVNDEANVSYDLFSVDSDEQTLDTIISQFNRQAQSFHSNLLAYRLDTSFGSELVIAHNIPNESAEEYSLTVSAGSDSAISSLGFSYIQNIEILSTNGSPYYISGKRKIGLHKKFDREDLTFSSGGVVINNSLSGQNFIEAGLSVDDLLIITGSGDDSGTYRIASISDSQIQLDLQQLPSGFLENSSSDVRFRVYSNSVSLSSIEFQKLESGSGASLIELFLDQDSKLKYQVFAEYQTTTYSDKSIYSLVDCDYFYDKEYTITFSNTEEGCRASLGSGEEFILTGKNSTFWLTSSDGVKLKFFCRNKDSVSSKITSAGSDLVFQIYGTGNSDFGNDCLKIGKIPFESFSNNFAGEAEGASTSLNSKFGMIRLNDLSDEVEHGLVNKPLSSLFQNGILRGFENLSVTINASGNYEFSLNQGYAFVCGKEFFVKESQNVDTGISTSFSDKLFLAIDNFGNLKVSSCSTDCLNPFDLNNHALLYCIEWDGSEISTFDLRLLISSSGYRDVESVIVSNDKKLGRFTTLSQALKYCSKYNDIYPLLKVPSVKILNGLYEETVSVDLSSMSMADWIANYGESTSSSRKNSVGPILLALYKQGFCINYALKIEGQSTEAVVALRLSLEFSDETVTSRGFLFIPGIQFTQSGKVISRLDSGRVAFENITFDNCHIKLTDLNIIDNSTSIHVSNCVFSFKDYTASSVDNTVKSIAIHLSELYDLIFNKGCLFIDRCSFYDSRILFDSPDRVNNVSLIGNRVIGTTYSALFEGDILTVAKSKNITISNNLDLNNLSGDTSTIVFNSLEPWTDRFARNIRVTENVFASNYYTLDPIVTNRFVLPGQLAGPVFGTSTLNALMSDVSVDGINRRVIRIAPDVSEDIYIPINLNKNEQLDNSALRSIKVFYSKDTALSQILICSIVKTNFAGIISSTSLSNQELVQVLESGFGSIFTGYLNTTSFSVSGSEDSFYYLKISRGTSSSKPITDYLYIHSIVYRVSSSILGYSSGGII